jgi:hypothetical protein
MQIVLDSLWLIAAAAAVQPASTAPSQEALALARALDLRPPMIARGSIANAEAIEQNLLTTHYVPLGAPCDPNLAECKEAARAVAKEVAPAKQAHLEAISAQYFARILDSKMSRAELTAALDLLDTPQGKSLVGAIRAAVEPPSSSEEMFRNLQLAYEAVPYTGPDPTELFYDRTKHLPRRPLPRVPRPIAPPAPPRPPER